MRAGYHVVAAALLVGMVASADTARESADFFAKCYQLEAMRDGDGLTSELKKAPTAARASYRYLYYQTVAFYLNHRSAEAHQRADLTLRTLKERKAPESTIAIVQKALQEWAAWDNERIQAASWEYGGGYTGFLLSEEKSKSKDLLMRRAKETRRDSTPWEPDVQDTHWDTTPETSGALFNALYKKYQQLPPESQAPEPMVLPADEGASPSQQPIP